MTINTVLLFSRENKISITQKTFVQSIAGSILGFVESLHV